ncbi:MAG: GNAT family N-acetyltransferase, partial [bacterium]
MFPPLLLMSFPVNQDRRYAIMAIDIKQDMKTIKGKKVYLRPLRLTDAPRFTAWLKDPAVNKYTTRKAVSLKEERKWIRNLRKHKNTCCLAMDTKDGVHIGSIGAEAQQKDKYGLLGILIGDKQYWDKGLGTEAMELFVSYVFKKWKLHRVELDVYEYNPRAIKVYKRLGFKVEGRRRERV